MRLSDLQNKDVININGGCKIGCISDVDVDWCHGVIRCLIVEKFSFFRLFCFFSQPPCVEVPLECIVSLDGDVILVNICL